MVRRAKLFPMMLALHTRKMVQIPATLFPICPWAPSIHVGDPDGTLGAWFWSSQFPANAAIWEVLSLSLLHPLC